MKIIIVAILSFAAVCCHAQEKATVTLNDGSYSVSGGPERQEKIEVKVRKGFGGEPIPLDDKIAALQEKLQFYQFMKRYKVDPDKKIDAVYSNRPLKSILAELLPNVPVKFDGVDGGVTVDNMVVGKTSLEIVLGYLDTAAGVYFKFSDNGMTISATPQ